MVLKRILEKLEISETSLNEAKFSEASLQKVSTLLATVLGHHLNGGEFKMLGGSLGKESFTKKGLGAGQGFKFMNEAGFMIRFGWLQKAKSSLFQINVIDYWDPKDGKKRWDTPTLTIKIADWMNAIDVVKELKDVILSGGHVNENNTFEPSKGSYPLTEAIKDSNKPPKKMIAYGTAMGVEYIEAEDTYQGYINKLEDAGKWDKEEYKGFQVEKNTVEKNSTEAVFKGAEKVLSEKKWSDPELVFGDIEKLTKIVATGGANGLIVAGAAGLGKCLGSETQIPVFGL